MIAESLIRKDLEPLLLSKDRSDFDLAINILENEGRVAYGIGKICDATLDPHGINVVFSNRENRWKRYYKNVYKPPVKKGDVWYYQSTNERLD